MVMTVKEAREIAIKLKMDELEKASYFITDHSNFIPKQNAEALGVLIELAERELGIIDESGKEE